MAHVAGGSSLLPAIVGMIRYRKIDKAMKLFAVFSVVGVLNLGLELILGMFKIRNYFLSDLYFLIEVPFIAAIYYMSIAAPFARRILRISSLLFIIVWVVQKCFFANPQQLSSDLAMITAIFLIAMSILTLNAYSKAATSRLMDGSVFWVLTGTIVYYAGSFAVMGLSNELLKMGLEYFEIAWYINWILFITSMLLYSKGLMCRSQE